MAALILEPYLPIEARSEIPLWVIIDEVGGAGDVPEKGDLVTLEVVAWVEHDREVLSTVKTGLPYTFVFDQGRADELLVRAISGMKDGGERYVSRRGELLAVGGLIPSASELTMRIRLIRVERGTKRKGNW